MAKCYASSCLAGFRSTESGPHGTVTVADLERSAEVFADINDPDVMSGAWS